ncbi:MAG: DHA2 family efflux MFS transporter permease subunit [Candidatus Aminicenantes bacterium]|nr:MAG: DHA2 family efflux MFS transporter permease subunit [Candidatus Aminicenantes bacterium]
MNVNSSEETTQGSEPVDYSRKWYVMAAVGMGILLGTIDASIVNVALPTLIREFNASFSTVQWVVLAYMLTLSTLTLTMGRWGDIIGKKQIYMAGMVVFTLGSMLCGISPSIYWLIGFRVFQAVGASMTAALGAAVITEAFPPQQRGKAIGAAGAIVSFGIVSGPAIGGMLIDFISWRWIFYVNVPIGIIGVILALRFVPNIKTAKGQRFDYGGASSVFISQLALLLALTVGQRIGFGNPIIIGLFVLCLVFFILFLLVESTFHHPMVDLKLFKNHLLGINLLNGFISFVSLGGIIILMPFYLENVLNYDPYQVGLLLAVLPVIGGIVSPISGALSDRFGSGSITVLGLLIMVGGYIGLTTLDAQTTILGFILTFIPIGLGMGIFQSPNNSAIMGAAPNHRLGLASSLLPVSRTLGNSSGIAAVGAFWASRMAFYAGPHMTKDLKQIPIPAQVTALKETLWGVALFTSVALILAVWGLFMKKKRAAKDV